MMMDYILSNSHRAIFICKLIAKTGFNIGQCQGTSVYRPYTRNLCCPAFASQSTSQYNTNQHSEHQNTVKSQTLELSTAESSPKVI